jgi:hypothetical protein
MAAAPERDTVGLFLIIHDVKQRDHEVQSRAHVGDAARADP